MLDLPRPPHVGYSSRVIRSDSIIAFIERLRESVLHHQLVTTQYEFLRSIVRSADRALSKPGDAED